MPEEAADLRSEAALDEPAAPTAGVLPPPGSADRLVLERVALAAWKRVGAGLLPDEAWTHWLGRVWALHADRIRAAHAHEAEPL